MRFVAAKCTQCGANIKVDDSKDAGICEHCGTAFVTEKAVNNYNNNYSIGNAVINVAGVDLNNLLIRAQQFEIEMAYDKAIEYYNKVLDIDAANEKALDGVSRLKYGRLSKIAGIKIQKEVNDSIDNLLRNREVIKAIKVFREATGLGLKESKDIIDSYRVESPTGDENNKQTAKSNPGGCYIATSVYDSYDCPEVWTLRRFRDYSLSNSKLGRTIVKIYYKLSPLLVKRFGDNRLFKTFWKNALDFIVSILQEKGYDSSPYEDNL